MWPLVLVMLTLPGLPAPGPIHRQHVSEGGWTLSTSRNAFTGRLACGLSGRAMQVEGGALVLAFPKAVDTSQAWLRIGSEPASPWRRLIPELRQMGVRLRFDDLDNPSRGRVPVPLRLVIDETTLSVAPDERRSPRRFVVAGLRDALERANAQGCAFPIPGASPAPDTSD